MNGVVFLVDCADHDRLSESKTELDVGLSSDKLFPHLSGNSKLLHTVLPLCVQALLADETIVNVPVLVLGNKIDRPEAISEGGLRGAFTLDGQVTGKVGESWSLFSIHKMTIICVLMYVYVPVLVILNHK